MAKLGRARLSIGGCEFLVECEGQQPYYDRSVLITLSRVETARFARLEKLYRRIGPLVELEYLELEMMTLDAESRMDMAMMNKRKSFPAMLTIGDPKAGQPGYLRLMTGLKTLRYLRGSVHADSTESLVTVGLEECVWIYSHWPKVQSIELFKSQARLRGSFKWLQAQRKDMYLY